MVKALFTGALLILISNYALASDWKKLPNKNTAIYTENKNFGARVILSDINTGIGIMGLSLLTVNSKCINRGATGEAYMYVNKTLVKLDFVCTNSGVSMYFAKSQKGKDYIFREFTYKKEVCYSFKKDIKGICFSAVGFGKASKKLSKIIVKRNNAL